MYAGRETRGARLLRFYCSSSVIVNGAISSVKYAGFNSRGSIGENTEVFFSFCEQILNIEECVNWGRIIGKNVFSLNKIKLRKRPPSNFIVFLHVFLQLILANIADPLLSCHSFVLSAENFQYQKQNVNDVVCERLAMHQPNTTHKSHRNLYFVKPPIHTLFSFFNNNKKVFINNFRLSENQVVRWMCVFYCSVFCFFFSILFSSTIIVADGEIFLCFAGKRIQTTSGASGRRLIYMTLHDFRRSQHISAMQFYKWFCWRVVFLVRIKILFIWRDWLLSKQIFLRANSI